MINRFFAFLLAFVVLLSSSLITVYAADSSDGYFADYDDTKFSPVNNTVVSIKHILQGAQDYHNGNITADEFVNDVLVTAKDGADANLIGLINTAVDSYNSAGAITRGFWDNLINGINGVITSNGGNVSGFPSGNTTVSVGQGYVVFEPYTAWYIYSDGASRYEIYATVYYNNGNVAKPKGRVFETAPQKNNILDGGGGILSISYNTSQDLGDSTRMHFDCDCYYWSYPNVLTRGFSVDVPWVVGDSPVDTTNLTPDVGVLSDDDFYRYIDNLVNNLDKLYPDMSTLDGKLQEILNKMDKLGNGCNCAELAAAVYALIDYLKDNNTGADFTDLNNTLTQLTNTLKSDINLKPIQDRLDDIYDVLSDIKLTLDEGVTEDSAEEDMTDSYERFKKSLEDKFHVSTIKSSIDVFSTVFFGSRAFSNDPKTGKVTVAAVYGDGSRSSASFVFLNFDFKFMGKTITLDLFEWVSFIPATTMETVRGFISFVLWFSFLLGLFRSLPGILSSGSTARALITDYVHNDD